MAKEIVNFEIGAERKNWTEEEVISLYELPYNDLLHYAHQTHRANFDANQVQISTLLSIKTGGCPENCSYCPQSAHYDTGLEKESLLDVEKITAAAKQAKEAGASRFCMGAAWRELHDRDVEKICKIVTEVKKVGVETCMTLGMVKKEQAAQLKEAGLDFYNHNIDSSEEFYEKIISTRKYQDRLDTLENIAANDINICSGGILGMGESRLDRAKMLLTLNKLRKSPKSIPINMLETVKGTPLENQKQFDIFEFIKTIAIARIIFPKSFVRLSAGRQNMSKEAQSMCFFAGANSIFYGEKLLTQGNPLENQDLELLEKLGIKAS
ncbi:MAG: biotin synthase BioB [Alphaproteobacteria bacterium]|jgi:biotin synthase|nr:biotin synthase BioB [Alphaproteobacteria bacterium]MBT5828336.1 biotin synthase BioB [Alphaproteobacteria bacterium]